MNTKDRVGLQWFTQYLSIGRPMRSVRKDPAEWRKVKVLSEVTIDTFILGKKNPKTSAGWTFTHNFADNGSSGQ